MSKGKSVIFIIQIIFFTPFQYRHKSDWNNIYFINLFIKNRYKRLFHSGNQNYKLDERKEMYPIL